MRFCYLIQSHREPRQIARLATTLRRQSPDCLVVVAHDESKGGLAPDLFGGDPAIRYFAVPGPVRRGYLSMLDPFFLAVRRLAAQGEPYDWLVTLSGQDYPLRPLAECEATLAAADCDGFVRWWPAFTAGGPWRRRKQGDRRYHYLYRDVAPAWRWLLPAARQLNRLQSRFHVHLAYGPRLGRRAARTPFEHGRVCYAGWQWTTLRRACAEWAAAEAQRDTGLVAYYANTICPDESLIQTLLVNAGRFRLVNDNLRYASTGDRSDGRAAELRVDDLPKLLEGGYHFGRKFDLARDARVLDLLDERLG